MTATGETELLWRRHHADWRDAAQVASQWHEAVGTEAGLLRSRTTGPWWEILAALEITLLVTREYEHLVVALGVGDGEPDVTFMRLPHPSGMVADRARGIVYVASTRNPNQVYTLAPVDAALERADAPSPAIEDRPLVPIRTHFYPGSLYLHDLALIDGELHANAVGQNAVVRLTDDGACAYVWWPRAIEVGGTPDLTRNYLQLNSIAAGDSVADSAYSASSAAMSARRPGHRNYPVDRRGVVFDGATREPFVRGLTRPHSARVHRDALWLGNSGYGELGVVVDDAFEPVLELQAWTRGLVFAGDVGFAGVSRVIPGFRLYAPGLDVDRSVCGVVAFDATTGVELARLVWPSGNQVFAIDWLPRACSGGFPFTTRRRRAPSPKHLFYAFQPPSVKENLRR